jgi:GT2 family glycosyltransferase
MDTRLILCGFAVTMSAIATAQFLAALRRIYWNPPEPGKSFRAPRISVIIPARDEEKDLEASVQSVLAQRDVDLEVFVVNDHSSDETGRIADSLAAADPRVRVIHDPALLPGWLGKCNAMHHALALTSAETLLFTDADILHAPDCFSKALAEMELHALGFLSLFPHMECVSFWENVILPALTGGIALLATPGINDPRSPDALGAGAFLMVRRSAFAQIGGFEPIKGEMLDDVALARLCKRNGCKVRFFAAPHLLHVRLYKGNSHAFWGMTKNILEGLHGRFWIAPAVMLLPVFVFWVPIACIASGASALDARLALIGTAAYGAQYASLWVGRALFRFHSVKALFFPMVALPVVCCMMRALYLYFARGAVHWRGRTVQVRGVAPRS